MNVQSFGNRLVDARSDEFHAFLNECKNGPTSLRMLANQCVGIILSSCAVIKETSFVDAGSVSVISQYADVSDNTTYTWDLLGTFTDTKLSDKLIDFSETISKRNPRVNATVMG